MATQYAFGQIVTNGLVLSLNAADNNSYAIGPQLVTNTALLNPGDGQYLTLIRTSTGSVNATGLGSAISGSRYRMAWTVTADRGSVGASLRINGTANSTPSVGVKAVGSYSTTFTALATGAMTLNCDNVGCDFDLDYVLIQQIPETWTDMSGNGNNGTLTNGPTFSTANGGAIVFDGIDDYVTGSLSSSTVGCISMWINPNSLINASSTGKTLIQLRWNGVADSEWYIAVGAVTGLLTSEYITVLDVSNSQRTAVADGGSLSANTWYNLVFNSEAGKYQIYINTVPKTQIVSAGGVSTLTNGNKVSIAALARTPEITNSSFFDGRVSNVQLYSGSLTTTQIIQNYTAQKSRFGL